MATSGTRNCAAPHIMVGSTILRAPQRDGVVRSQREVPRLVRAKLPVYVEQPTAKQARNQLPAGQSRLEVRADNERVAFVPPSASPMKLKMDFRLEEYRLVSQLVVDVERRLLQVFAGTTTIGVTLLTAATGFLLTSNRRPFNVAEAYPGACGLVGLAPDASSASHSSRAFRGAHPRPRNNCGPSAGEVCS